MIARWLPLASSGKKAKLQRGEAEGAERIDRAPPDPVGQMAEEGDGEELHRRADQQGVERQRRGSPRRTSTRKVSEKAVRM